MKKILFLGDFFSDDKIVNEDLQSIISWIKENDYYTVLNLEGSIDSLNKNKIVKRGPNLCNDINVIDILSNMNVICVCLANNHMMDYGEEGLTHTIDLLDANNINHIGAGRNLIEALRPFYFEHLGEKYAIINFGWDVEETVYATDTSAGCAPRVENVILESIENAKKEAEHIIVCLHWGFEFNRLPMPYDIDLAHKIIDSGAEFIIGHHPHCIQPKEIYKGKRIYYSLGNFYFGAKRTMFKKKFNENPFNQSDYGLCVEYNMDRNEFLENIVFYDKDINTSKIIDKQNSNLLKDISNVDYFSKKYVSTVKKSKKNINPILDTNGKQNLNKIKKLYKFYKLKKTIKKIIGKK